MKCQSGKVGYVTRAKAHIHRIRLGRKHTHDRQDYKFWCGPLTVYRCQFCGEFHVGHDVTKQGRAVA